MPRFYRICLVFVLAYFLVGIVVLPVGSLIVGDQQGSVSREVFPIGARATAEIAPESWYYLYAVDEDNYANVDKEIVAIEIEKNGAPASWVTIDDASMNYGWSADGRNYIGTPILKFFSDRSFTASIEVNWKDQKKYPIAVVSGHEGAFVYLFVMLSVITLAAILVTVLACKKLSFSKKARANEEGQRSTS